VQVTETVTDAGSAAYTMRELHYSAGWQVIQEGEYIEAELGGQVVYMSDEYNENVWSLAYVDAMVLQDRYDIADPKPAPERTYAIQDASYTVTSLLQSVGGVWQVVQRHVLDPYGGTPFGDPALAWRGLCVKRPCVCTGYRLLDGGMPLESNEAMSTHRYISGPSIDMNLAIEIFSQTFS